MSSEINRAIVGYSGFVGSNLLKFYKFNYFYNSKNFNEATNMSFDELYFCGIPAVKWYANKYPLEDKETIDKIKDILKTINVKKIILISTIDVYENVDLENNEDYECDWVINHEYGRNRYLFEYFIKNTFTDYNIVRLPALFGSGLKKNIIYDLINNNQIYNIQINSCFQWYDLNWLKNDIDIIIRNNIKICNLFTEPIDTKTILEMFNYDIGSFNNSSKKITYNTKTKYSTLFNSSVDGYIKNKKQVEESIIQFIKFNNIQKSHLCVSNICIKKISNFQFSHILKLYGIQNIQIAPTTMITEWEQLKNIDLSIFKNSGLNVYSFQSITYTLNELNIFNVDTRDKLYKHLTNVIDTSIQNNIKVLVFGCPRNRSILNNDTDYNNNEFIRFFMKVGDYCLNKDITICIEPNSKKYNCNYINTIEEAGDIVEKINKPNIKMMIDIGNVIMENDNLNIMYKYKHLIYNIDVAEENMKPFQNSNKMHETFKNILLEINYNKNINLEMLIQEDDEECELEILNKSLVKFVEIFGS
jgi:sugar phosphate isomerase/epimerase